MSGDQYLYYQSEEEIEADIRRRVRRGTLVGLLVGLLLGLALGLVIPRTPLAVENELADADWTEVPFIILVMITVVALAVVKRKTQLRTDTPLEGQQRFAVVALIAGVAILFLLTFALVFIFIR